MNPEAKALWLAWLRDPKNEQAQSALRMGDAFCCLGGLCEVYRTATRTTDIIRTATYVTENAVALCVSLR